MAYVDGYVMAVPIQNKSKYVALAQQSAAVFKDHGAISVVENWGEEVPDGKVTSMPLAVQCQEGETVVFSWIIWPSKTVRDAGNKAAMEDPRLANWDPKTLPFDGQRMIYGGFETIVDE